MLTPHYTAIEFERRFLVTGPLPRLGPAIDITDRHLTSTRAYLRLALHPDGTVQRRLCKQYPAEASGCAAIAVAELSPHDFVLYEHMEANVLIKSRTVATERGLPVAIDVFAGALQGLVLCEVSSAMEADVCAFGAPPWATVEVTADPFFVGGTLAFATPEQLRQRIALP